MAFTASEGEGSGETSNAGCIIEQQLHCAYQNDGVVRRGGHLESWHCVLARVVGTSMLFSFDQ